MIRLAKIAGLKWSVPLKNIKNNNKYFIVGDIGFSQLFLSDES